MRENEKKGKKCSTVCVTIRDTMLCNISRQRQLSCPTNISSEISDVAFSIVKSEWKTGKPIRMLTVTAASLTDENEASFQSDFFDEGEEKRKKFESLEKTIDKIRGKHGRAIISRAGVISNDIGISNSEIRKTDEENE